MSEKDAKVSDKGDQDPEKISDAPSWMWAIALLGAVLVLGSIGFMLYEAAAGDSSPPNVTVHADSVVATQNASWCSSAPSTTEAPPPKG